MGKTAIHKSRFQQKFAKDNLRGRYFFTLRDVLNEAFLRECEKQRRDPSDLLRIILEDRYMSEVRYPKTVEGKPHVDEPVRKREVA